MEKRIFWMDVLRGGAILAVVICHQKDILHSSEYIQCLTLYSVTSLIFLMGITKGLALKKFWQRNNLSILNYTFQSMKSTILSYVLASVILDISLNGVTDNFLILNHLLNFNAAAPFYFIGLFIKLSLWAPLIYFFIYKIFIVTNCRNEYTRYVFVIVFLLSVWCVGYFSIDHYDVFGQSYLFVYSIGILLSFKDLHNVSVKSLIISIGTLIIGTFFTYKFYFARVAGNYHYSELIDILDPKLQMNPPNLSIILYSFGVIGIVYYSSNLLENTRYFSIPFKVLACWGKYSLDIFLWHIFIQQILEKTSLAMLPPTMYKRVIYYSAMLFLPIIGRIIYTKTKENVYASRNAQ